MVVKAEKPATSDPIVPVEYPSSVPESASDDASGGEGSDVVMGDAQDDEKQAEEEDEKKTDAMEE